MKKKTKPKFKEIQPDEVSKWINSLTVKNFPKIRSAIIKECYISRQTFSLWKNGVNKPSPLAMEKINQIAKEYVPTKEKKQ